MIVELPNMAEAMAASLALRRVTAIAFSTVAAMPIEEFDKQFGMK